MFACVYACVHVTSGNIMMVVKLILLRFICFRIDPHFLQEPRPLVWLPTLHRIAATENGNSVASLVHVYPIVSGTLSLLFSPTCSFAAKHETHCAVCKVYPIIGFRYAARDRHGGGA